MKRYLFIYNPEACRGRSESRFSELKEIARKELPNCVFITSAEKGDICHIAEDGAASFEVIVACGGDGTVREVVAGIACTGARLGIIPMGSGNDFAGSLGISTDIKKAVKVLKNDNARSVDIGRCNNFIFINTLEFGFDGLTNKLASESSLRNGTIRYLYSALKANSRYKSFQVETNTGECWRKQSLMMLTIANGRREGGNFIIAPQASMADGQLDLIAVDPVSRRILPPVFAFFYVGKAPGI